MMTSATKLLILSVICTLGSGQLSDDQPIQLPAGEDSVYSFIYLDHDVFNLAEFKQGLEEKGEIYLVFPSDTPLHLHVDNNRSMNDFGLTLYSSDLQPYVAQLQREVCFFHGKIHHQKNSFAVIDVCNTPRIKVFISLNGEMLLLKPNGDDSHGRQTHLSAPSSASFFSSAANSARDNKMDGWLQTREKRQIQSRDRPLFLELYVVCDHTLYNKSDGNIKLLEEKVIMVVEILKELYLDLGIYIHLSGVEVWNEKDLIGSVNSGIRTMFDDFLLWRRDNLLPRHRHDFAVFMSGKGYSDSDTKIPLVFDRQMCSRHYSGLAIKEVDFDDPILPSLLARYIGFGMALSKQTTSECNCAGPNDCIMGTGDSNDWEMHGMPTSFSPCSRAEVQHAIRRRLLRCLTDQPADFVFPPRCGDGNQDSGEECDCGSEQECRDPCCNPVTCILDQSNPECQPTTLSPSTNPVVTPHNTISSSEFETTYVDEFVTELATEHYDLATEHYDLATSLEEDDDDDVLVTVASYFTSPIPATERPLTENEKVIRKIKELLGTTNLQSPPSLIQGPGGTPNYFTETSNVTLTCHVAGLPKPNITWFKDGLQLTLDDASFNFIGDDGTLNIIHAAPSDGGDYYCQAANNHGLIVSEKATLSLAYLDELSSRGPLKLIQLDERDSQLLRCDIPDSNPAPEVFWTKDIDTKEPLASDDRIVQLPSGNLLIGNVLTEDEGDYICIVRNPVTDEERVGQIVIVKVNALAHAPLWEYTSPSSMDLLIGVPLSLHCVASGSPTPVVKWEKFLSEGSQADGGADLKGYGHILMIPYPDVSDSGMYRCTGSNGVGGTIETVFTVSIQGAPEWITKPEDVEIPAGSSHSFLCEATGYPLPNITWLVNGEPAQKAVLKYPHLSYTSLEGYGVFNISDINGIYLTVVLQCVAENQHGRLLANAYANIVAFPARIISPPPHSITALEGEDIRIPCQAFGAPKPHVVWQVGVKLLEVEDDGSLFITNTAIGDSNSYFCKARNNFGLDYERVSVKIRGLTVVTLSPRNIDAVEESALTLTCQVDHYADRAPEIKWSRGDGTPLDFNRTLIETNETGFISTLSVEVLTLNDTGLYICKATTDYDEAADQAFITVTEKIIIQPPTQPGNITVYFQPTSHLLVTWEYEYTIDAPVSSFVIESRNNHFPDKWQVMKVVPGERDSGVVKIHPYVTYWFRVIAKNEAGMAVRQRKYPVHIPSSTPAVNPQNVAVSLADPQYILVTWDEMPPIEHGAPRFFYRIKWRAIGTKRWTYEKIRDHRQTEFSFEMDRSIGAGFEISVKSGNSLGNGPRSVPMTVLFEEPTTASPPTTTPSWLFEQTRFERVLEGSSHKLNCSSSEGSNPSASWSKDDSVNDTANYSIEEDGSIYFTSFSEDNAGQYECTMQSPSSGGYITATHVLILRRRTLVSTDPSELKATVSSFVEVTCSVILDPSIVSADILWVDSSNERVSYYYDDINGRVYRNDSTLIIEEILHSDAGNYTCIAHTTQDDYSQATFSLTVEDPKPPTVSPELLSVNIQDPKTATIIWGSVSGEDAGGPVVQYHAIARVSGDIEGDINECRTPSTTCTFKDLIPSETYEVFVSVGTAAGYGPFSSAMYFTLPDPVPVTPGLVGFDKIRVWAKTLIIRWTAPEEGGLVNDYIISYGPVGSNTVQEKKKSAPETLLKISSLIPLTTYNITIQAENLAGRGPKATRIVTTKSKKV